MIDGGDEKNMLLKSDTEEKYEINHIRELDGIRALFIIIVAWYHIWQQSWLSPSLGSFSLEWLIRNGSIFVDGLILLSGFCLFLPYARSIVYKAPYPNTKTFYLNRIARIVPSYLFAILIVLIFFAIPNGEYQSTSFAFKDFFTHLFFVHNLFPDTLSFSHLIGSLWTVGVEMQLYIIFPLLARCFTKKPFLTYLGMVLIGVGSCTLIGKNYYTINSDYWLNNTLTFFSTFANGMLGAYIYIKLTKVIPRKWYLAFLYTIISIGCIFLYRIIIDYRMTCGNERKWQIDFRYIFSIINMIMVISTILASKWYRFVFNNRLMNFLAIISYNLYIYHQYIAVKLKELKIPFWEGEEYPNIVGNEDWKVKYTIICTIVVIIVATITTFFIERPCAKIIKRKIKQ